MIPLSDSFPLALVGGTFTALGILKVCGFRRGIMGGAGRPVACRVLGSCPTWSRQANILATVLFFIIGLSCLGVLLALLLKTSHG